VSGVDVILALRRLGFEVTKVSDVVTLRSPNRRHHVFVRENRVLEPLELKVLLRFADVSEEEFFHASLGWESGEQVAPGASTGARLTIAGFDTGVLPRGKAHTR
jgi:hypothetical protein